MVTVWRNLLRGKQLIWIIFYVYLITQYWGVSRNKLPKGNIVLGCLSPQTGIANCKHLHLTSLLTTSWLINTNNVINNIWILAVCITYLRKELLNILLCICLCFKLVAPSFLIKNKLQILLRSIKQVPFPPMLSQFLMFSSPFFFWKSFPVTNYLDCTLKSFIVLGSKHQTEQTYI